MPIHGYMGFTCTSKRTREATERKILRGLFLVDLGYPSIGDDDGTTQEEEMEILV